MASECDIEQDDEDFKLVQDRHIKLTNNLCIRLKISFDPDGLYTRVQVYITATCLLFFLLGLLLATTAVLAHGSAARTLVAQEHVQRGHAGMRTTRRVILQRSPAMMLMRNPPTHVPVGYKLQRVKTNCFTKIKQVQLRSKPGNSAPEANKKRSKRPRKTTTPVEEQTCQKTAKGHQTPVRVT